MFSYKRCRGGGDSTAHRLAVAPTACLPACLPAYPLLPALPPPPPPLAASAAAEVVEAACGIAPFMAGEVVENVASGIDCYSIRQPLGVSAGWPPGSPPSTALHCTWRCVRAQAANVHHTVRWPRNMASGMHRLLCSIPR